MHLICPWPGETLARSAHPLDSLKYPGLKPVAVTRVIGSRVACSVQIWCPLRSNLKGSLHEGGRCDGDRELLEPVRSWSSKHMETLGRHSGVGDYS